MKNFTLLPAYIPYIPHSKEGGTKSRTTRDINVTLVGQK